MLIQAIHNFFKEKLKFLVTDTVDGPDVSTKCIRVRLSSGGGGNGRDSSRKRKERGSKPFDSRGSSNWPENVGKFLRFEETPPLCILPLIIPKVTFHPKCC